MKTSEKALRLIYRFIIKAGHVTRTELANELNLSDSAVRAAVTLLSEAELISSAESYCGGKKEDVYSVSAEKDFLLISLCETDKSYAITPRAGIIGIESQIEIADDKPSLLSKTERHIEKHPVHLTLAAISPAEREVRGNISSPLIESHKIKTDAILSSPLAVCKCCESLAGDGRSFIFLHIGESIRGCSSSDPNQIHYWGRMKTGNNYGESMESLIAHERDEKKLAVFLERFISVIDTMLSPDEIFISSQALPSNTIRAVCKNPKITDLSDIDPILSGLSYAASEILFERSFKNLKTTF